MRTSSLALLALAGVTFPAVPALANSAPPAPPKYSLSIVEGVSTLPERQIVSTSARVEPHASIAVTIYRGGTPIARDTGSEYAGFSQVPQVGDVVTVESPVGVAVGSIVYDGLPSLDPTVCAGAANFSGQRSAGLSVTGGYYTLVLHTDPYGHSEVRQTAAADAQVTTLVGGAFSGGFLTPLALGQTVWATETLETPLAGGASFTYSSENDRPVGACPVPPAPPAPPAAPALLGEIVGHPRTTLHKLLTSGWLDHVTINQPGTVVQDLYLQGGSVPAFAAKSRHARHRKPPALLLARGSASASAAGTVAVVLRATSKGRHRLKGARSVRAVLITTLHSTTGAKLTLARRSLTLHR